MHRQEETDVLFLVVVVVILLSASYSNVSNSNRRIMYSINKK